VAAAASRLSLEAASHSLLPRAGIWAASGRRINKRPGGAARARERWWVRAAWRLPLDLRLYFSMPVIKLCF